MMPPSPSLALLFLVLLLRFPPSLVLSGCVSSSLIVALLQRSFFACIMLRHLSFVSFFLFADVILLIVYRIVFLYPSVRIFVKFYEKFRRFFFFLSS